MLETTEKQRQSNDVKSVFAKIAELLREEFVAMYHKETETSLVIRLIGGDTFRLSLESIV